MKLLFLTTHNLATNPRLYKELTLAIQSGYEVELICFSFENWSKPFDEELKKNLAGVRIISIPAGRVPFQKWFFSVATESLWRFVGKLVSLPLSLVAQAVSRRNRLIIQALNQVSVPDWVIGHNPGALFATAFAGRKFGCRTGFDVEDYHAGEGSNKYLQQFVKYLMVRVLPSMNYVSFASSLIKKEVETDTNFTKDTWFTLMNLFPAEEFREPERKEAADSVKMVWFSQNIDYGRGLELLLPVIEKAEGKLKLDLYGNANKIFYNQELKSLIHVSVHPPLSQKNLHLKLAEYEIGLALDFATDFNREIALTNKILAYLQAGLYVFATNTTAHRGILKKFQEHGFCFNYKENNSADAIEQVLTGIDAIRSKREWRYQNTRTFNWESASMELLSVWTSQ